MLNTQKFATIAILGVFFAASAHADNKSPTSVNGTAIPQARIDMLMKEATARGQNDSPELRKAVIEELVNRELLSQAASKKGMNKKSDVVQQIEMARQSILANAYIQELLKNHPLNDDVIKNEYERINKMRGNKEYKVSHILVKTESEAKDIIEQLKSKKFEDVAMDKSQDPGSSVKGGDLGWAVPGNFVKPFTDAMMSLNKGQISSPVQSQFGWHVIRLEDTRDLKAPSFEEVKPQIIQHLQQQTIFREITELRSRATIK